MVNSDAVQIGLRIGFVGLGIFGACFVAYGVYTSWTGEALPSLERIALPLSSVLTLAGAMLTAGSIYMTAWSASHAPDLFSKVASAPLTISGGAITLLVLGMRRKVSPILVNGFALLGLAGALLRMQPPPHGWPH
jgi:hypothetical protein